MNNINKTLYIPLYGKSYVSELGIILNDSKAMDIWNKEGFELKGKSKNKYLAYYMAMRSKVIDDYVLDIIHNHLDFSIVHLGCGLDSRCIRLNLSNSFYDIDFKEVIEERKKYYEESASYKMIASDIRDTSWFHEINNKNVIIIMEGVSMYIDPSDLKILFNEISTYFNKVFIIMDTYSIFAAKASKYKNPINEVGVSNVYGIDDPTILNSNTLSFYKQHEMTPIKYIDELQGLEKKMFLQLYAGKTSKKLYKLFEYRK